MQKNDVVDSVIDILSEMFESTGNMNDILSVDIDTIQTPSSDILLKLSSLLEKISLEYRSQTIFYEKSSQQSSFDCTYLQGLLSILYVSLLNRRKKQYPALIACNIYFILIFFNGSTAHTIIRGSILREVFFTVTSLTRDQDSDVEENISISIPLSPSSPSSSSTTTTPVSIKETKEEIKSPKKRKSKQLSVAATKDNIIYSMLHPLLFKIPRCVKEIDRMIIHMSWNILCELVAEVSMSSLYQDATTKILSSLYNYAKVETEELCGELFKVLFPVIMFKRSFKTSLENPLRIGHDLILSSIQDLLSISPLYITSIYALIQRMILQCPEKQEIRSITVDSIIPLSLLFPNTLKNTFNKFILKASRSPAVNTRLCSVELCEKLLVSKYILTSRDLENVTVLSNSPQKSVEDKDIRISLDSRGDDEETNSPERPVGGTLFLDESVDCFLNIILKRWTDSSPSIRTKAGISLSHVLQYAYDSSLEGANQIMMTEDKSSTRKSALSVYRALIIYASYPQAILLQKDLDIFSQMCVDPAVSVRKTAIQTLFDIYTSSSLSILFSSLWFPATLSCANDNETSVQLLALNSLKTNLFDNIALWSKTILQRMKNNNVINTNNKEEEHTSISLDEPKLDQPIDSFIISPIESISGFKCWRILEEYQVNYESMLQKSIQLICEKNILAGGQMINTIYSVTNWTRLYSDRYMSLLDKHVTLPECSKGNMIHVQRMEQYSWLLVSMLSKIYPSQISISSLVTSSKIPSLSMNIDINNYIYTTLYNCIPKIKMNEAQSILDYLFSLIHDYSINVQSLHIVISTWVKLYQAIHPTLSKLKKHLVPQINSLYKDISEQLKKYIFGDTYERQHYQHLINPIFTAGELCLIGSEETEECILASIHIDVPHDVLMAIQSLLVTSLPQITISNNRGNSQSMNSTNDSNDNGNSIPPITLSQVVAGEQQQVGGNEETIVPSQVRAHAIIAFGKFCLQDASLAKKQIAMLIRELQTSPDPIIRNNILLILGDICKRHTSIVERYIPSMCSCIQDKEKIIAIHALTIFSNLLMENYFKLKPILLYYFLLGLAENDDDVKLLSNQIIETEINVLYPKSLCNNIIEIMVLLNGCIYMNIYKIEGGTEKYKPVYSGGNKRSIQCRNRIYRTILSLMPDEHKLLICTKLCQDILGPIADETTEIPDSTNIDDPYLNLIRDCFSILCSKEIKIGKRIDEEDNIPEQLQEAKTKVLNKIHKRAVIEQILPLLVTLKHKLESHQSSLLKELMVYFKILFGSYKKELSEFLESDPHLERELEYDMRQFEDQSNLNTSGSLQEDILNKINSLATPLIQRSTTNVAISPLPSTPILKYTKRNASISTTTNNNKQDHFTFESAPRSSLILSTPQLSPAPWNINPEPLNITAQRHSIANGIELKAQNIILEDSVNSNSFSDDSFDLEHNGISALLPDNNSKQIKRQSMMTPSEMERKKRKSRVSLLGDESSTMPFESTIKNRRKSAGASLFNTSINNASKN
ncbi:hypothetical protein WA158_004664 [Blastocystis sp. Blastoise]